MYPVFGDYRIVGAATAAGAEALPKPPGALLLLIEELYTAGFLERYRVKITLYPKKMFISFIKSWFYTKGIFEAL